MLDILDMVYLSYTDVTYSHIVCLTYLMQIIYQLHIRILYLVLSHNLCCMCPYGVISYAPNVRLMNSCAFKPAYGGFDPHSEIALSTI